MQMHIFIEFALVV